MIGMFLKIYLTSIISVLLGFMLAGVLSRTGLINFIGAKTSKITRLGIHPSPTPVPALYIVSPRIAHANASAMLREGLVEPVDLYIAILASNVSLRIMYTGLDAL
ncbi:hypothetical protein [Pyrodictium occultum]|uniref:hypothetical protein n=1 Tax=Pyrodictium occultum TaxID=2309 RepID=UPI0014435527|nr:hypothetical protein [Pyrodictium occultum]